jgi:uncharacterized protein (DUF305 family)
MRMTWRVVTLLVVISALPLLTCQRNAHLGTRTAPEEPSWAALMQSVAKMHASMSSVQSSGQSDVDFATLMLPHHQAAIDMAKAELMFGGDPQMRRLAQEVITDQQSEIELMQLWLKRRGALSATPRPRSGTRH